eukprot:7631832-Pyramimonas_sp.AAC.1
MQQVTRERTGQFHILAARGRVVNPGAPPSAAPALPVCVRSAAAPVPAPTGAPAQVELWPQI